MLTQIHIRDLATIEELHLQLKNGCTMITGETGAGKSIFIEAIELGLGGRASPNLIRPGKDKADISLCFDITRFPQVIACLQKLDLDQDTTNCIIRRLIMNDGRSRCYVNGVPATVQLVKELGELLFHLHGQHEQQVLLKTETQRDMLDRYADHLPLVSSVKQITEAWKELQEQINTLRNQLLSQQVQGDYLQFQLDELTALHLQPNEWETLEVEHHRLTHADELLRHIQTVQQLIDGQEQNILSRLTDSRKTIESVTAVEPKAKEWVNTLDSVVIHLTDLVSELEDYAEHTELDPKRLQVVEERVSQLFTVARKHKILPQELMTFKENLIHQLATLPQHHHLDTLIQKRSELETQYHQLTHTLGQSRQQSALLLENEITATIQSLSLPHGQFKIAFDQEIESPHLLSHGKEKITFLIKTNPDQSLQPIAKVISGGELSRLSLASHLALANKTSIPTLVFDEVDTGLSGATAEKMGRLLRHLGDSYQVFCITHQPQVAANGLHHLLVEKYFLGNNTHTRLRLLNPVEKINEIARMLGGEKITQKTLAHAKEIFDNCTNLDVIS